VLNYCGSKSRLLKKILPLFPPHRVYVEPFGGSASILLNKEPAKVEIYNDLNGDVVNFFRMLREHPGEMLRRLSLIPYSRQVFKEAMAATPRDDFQRAELFWIWANQRFNGAMGKKTTGWRRAGARCPALTTYYRIPRLVDVIERLQRVQIECKDFADVLRFVDGPDTFTYCDPPYVGFEKQYDDLFLPDDHARLAELLCRFTGKAMVSYYPDDDIRKLYPGWKCIEFERTNYAANARKNNRSVVKEMLLLNYDLPEKC